MYQTIIFDLDGTLLDTLDDLTGAVNYALTSFALPTRSREEIRSFVGNGIAKLINRAVPAGTDEASTQAATDAHAPYVADMIWLLEQGYIVVTSDNAVWFPKGDAAPEPVTKPQPRKGGKKGKKPAAPAKGETPKA